jgi:thiamine-phosphate pyrophosphorylase
LLLYYITDRSQFPGDESARRRRLLEKIAEAVRCGVDFVQLREKDLTTRDLETLAREVVATIHELRTENKELKTALLVNSRTDIAAACCADGVHLRSDDISAVEVRKTWTRCGAGAPSTSSRQALARVTVGISCHTPGEVAYAAAQGADFAVFGPIFEKKSAPDARPAGLEALRLACRAKISVLALGGITVENAESCIQAGTAGIAGIRLFQENEMSDVVSKLRSLGRSSVFGR